MIDELKDVSAERAVLAGIYKFGQEAFIDVSDIIQASSFTIDTFQALYRCMEHIFQNNAAAQLDVPSIYSAANALGYYKHLDAQKERKLVEAVVVTHVERSSIRRLAAKIRKLEIASLLHNELSVAQDELREITGEEAIGNILRIVENRILDFSTNLTDIDGGQAEILTDGLEDLVDYVIKNPVKQLGLRTGFDKHDRAIGGGYRPGTVNVLAARIKQGKSHWCNNVAVNVAEDGIPVLYCDTEMGSNDQKFRTLARFSGVSINDLETGQFANDPAKVKAVRDAARKLKGLPYYYKSVAGMPFEEILAFIRRWLVNVVGMDENGKAKPCLVIYDYLKLMDDSSLSKNIAEHQALGFMVTGMHNFAVKYGIPFLACVQLNRDGIDKEDSSAISQSDRIAWLCSNLTILKKKSEEELSDSTQQSRKYNRKLVVLFTRHGPGLDDGDYINLETRYDIGLIKEGPYKNESPSNRNEGFVVEDSGPIPFGD